MNPNEKFQNEKLFAMLVFVQLTTSAESWSWFIDTIKVREVKRDLKLFHNACRKLNKSLKREFSPEMLEELDEDSHVFSDLMDLLKETSTEEKPKILQEFKNFIDEKTNSNGHNK